MRGRWLLLLIPLVLACGGSSVGSMTSTQGATSTGSATSTLGDTSTSSTSYDTSGSLQECPSVVFCFDPNTPLTTSGTDSATSGGSSSGGSSTTGSSEADTTVQGLPLCPSDCGSLPVCQEALWQSGFFDGCGDLGDNVDYDYDVSLPEVMGDQCCYEVTGSATAYPTG